VYTDGELEAVEGPAPLLHTVRQAVDVELFAVEGHNGHLTERYIPKPDLLFSTPYSNNFFLSFLI
jgi:hypothetical protein